MNHSKKFCLNSGFDTLVGLSVKLKNPNHHKQIKSKRQINDSLTHAMQDIQGSKRFIPKQKQFRNDLLSYQRHEQNIQYARPYIHDQTDSNRKSKSLSIKGNQCKQDRYYEQLTNFQENGRSKAYSLTPSHIIKFKESNGYISPPTRATRLQNDKMFSILDRSDMSIRNMPQQQKRQYVLRKILELQNISQTYRKNGGKDDQFMENTTKMREFYQRLLDDINNHRHSKFGKMSNGTRVSTPISKLQQLANSQVLTYSNIKPQSGTSPRITPKIYELNQKSMASRQQKNRKRFKTQIPSNQNDVQDETLDQHQIRKLSKDPGNQIIVIPINQQPLQMAQNYPYPNKQSQIQLKYLQSLMSLKDQENKRLIQIMEKQHSRTQQNYENDMKNKHKESKINDKRIKNLQEKYAKFLQNQNKQRPQNITPANNQNFRISNFRNRTQHSQDLDPQYQYREHHPSLNDIRKLKLQQSGFYTQDKTHIPYEQKILLQMQKEQRDELQLFSHLPKEIQQIKLQSIKQMTQKRFQMEKQVIAQKLQKLKIKEQLTYFEHQRKLVNEEIQNQEKKIDIHKLMKKKIKDIVRKQFQNRRSSSSSSSSGSNELDNGQIEHFPVNRRNKVNAIQSGKKSSKRSQNNATPIDF